MVYCTCDLSVVMPPKPEITNQKVEQAVINVPAFTPVNNTKPVFSGLSNVTRNLFSDGKIILLVIFFAFMVLLMKYWDNKKMSQWFETSNY